MIQDKTKKETMTVKKICPHYYEYEDWPKNIPMCWKTEMKDNRMKKCEHKYNYLNCPVYKSEIIGDI